MSILERVTAWLPWIPWHRARRTDELSDELRAHLDMAIADRIARGESRESASANARREFGNVSLATELARDQWGSAGAWIEANVIRNLHHAVRRLRRAPVFTITSVLTLTIGIGACALMMSLVSTILLKPLPYKQPDRLEMIWGSYPNANLGFREQPTHGMVFSIIRDNTKAFESIAAFRGASFNLGDATKPERLDGVQATGEFFQTLGVAPEIGRFYERANETPGSDHVAVLSDAVWRRRFGADPNIIGRVITLNAESFTVIGVAARGFAFPRGSEMPGDFQFAAVPEVWVPLKPPAHGITDLAIVGRLRAGVTYLAARQDMDRVMAVVRRTVPIIKNSRPDELLVPLREQLVGRVEPMLVSLLAGVVLVLVIACVNTAQLLLAQLHTRRRELAIRAALGGSTRRLAAEVLTDVLLLVTAGGAAGLAAGIAGMKLLRTYAADHLPRASELTFDTHSAFAALGVIALAAIMVSLIPMRLGSRVQLMDTLRSGGRGAGLKGISLKARRALVVGELAGSLVLVASAGLLVRTLSHQLNANLGFDAVHGVTFEVSLPPISYPERPFSTGMEHAPAVRFLSAALDNIRALPGVTAAGIGKPLPLSGAQQASVFTPEGELPPMPPGAISPIAQFSVASGDMVRALGTSIVAGRDFLLSDGTASPAVVIVNESMAEWLWPGKSASNTAIGKRIRVGTPQETTGWPWMTVIGVVANMKRYSLTETPRPEMIVPYTQNPYLTFSSMQFVIRSNLETSVLLAQVQRAIAAVDPTIPLAHVRTIEDLVATNASNARFVTRFMAGFGVDALVLTIVGVYGVIGYSAQQRRQEFGLRRALGAGPREILQLILGESLRLTGVGIALGFVLTAMAGLAMRPLLFDVSPFDPSTLIGSIVVIAAATIAASLVPAASAARVEPRVALEE
ncbi:MAG TPA: ABC transporter permease [Gemmatimonadaceae bacterium]|jgi:predicted permease